MRLDQETNEYLFVRLFDCLVALKALDERARIIRTRRLTEARKKMSYRIWVDSKPMARGIRLPRRVLEGCWAELLRCPLGTSWVYWELQILNGDFDHAVDIVKQIMVIYTSGLYDRYGAAEVEEYVKPLLTREGKYIRETTH